MPKRHHAAPPLGGHTRGRQHQLASLQVADPDASAATRSEAQQVTAGPCLKSTGTGQRVCEGEFSLTGAGVPPPELALLRFARLDGWIGRVQVTPAELTVDVRGSHITGCELEPLRRGRPRQPYAGRPGRYRVPAGARPAGVRMAVAKRGTSWLDYRSIDAGSGWAGDLASAGVEFDMPVDPQASGSAAGWRRRTADRVQAATPRHRTADQKQKMLKTAAAFATQDGGTMVFGIDPDELTVTGLGDQDPKKLRDRLYALVHGTVVPAPSVMVTDYQIDGKTILVMEVPPGPEPPYGLAVDKGSHEKPEFYIRSGSSTYTAQPADLRRAARSRPLAEEPHGRRTPISHR